MSPYSITLSLLLASVVLVYAENVITMRKPTKKRDMSVFHDICLKDSGGKLEDWMFQYASLHGLARNKKMTGKFDADIFARLKNVFKFPLSLLDIIHTDKCEKYEVAIDKRHCTFDRGFVQYIEGTDPVVLQKSHLQSWFYFYNCVKQIRQEFTLVDSLIEEAKKVLNTALEHAKKSKHVRTDKTVTFIGLIVKRVNRGMDYTGQDAIVPSASFYRKAMDFFEGNYNNIIYMVYAEDVNWAKKNLEGGPFVYVESESDELVMSIMGSCRHMIISPGAFSFWSAFLANGETIYYKRSDETENTQHYSYHKMDYYLPYWRPMQ